MAQAVDTFLAMGVRSWRLPAPDDGALRRQVRHLPHAPDPGHRGRPSFLPDALPAELAFPLFIKPRVGRGGVSAFPVRNARELAFFVDYVPNPVVQAFLDGPEFTIDVLCDFAGRPIAVVPRERVVVRAGVVDRGRRSPTRA